MSSPVRTAACGRLAEAPASPPRWLVFPCWIGVRGVTEANRSSGPDVPTCDDAELGTLEGLGTVHGRGRGGADASRPRRLVAGPGDRCVAARAAARPGLAPHRRDARRRDRADLGSSRHGAGGDARADWPTRAAARLARRPRAASSRSRDTSVDRVAGDGRELGRAVPVRLWVDAGAGPARAHLRPARAHRRRQPRARDRAARPAPRAPAPAPCLVGQLAFLAGPRHRAGLGAHAPVPGLPPCRHPARLSLLRRLRRGRRPPHAHRRAGGTDVPVVGRAATAAIRNGRGPGHGRADASPRDRRHRRPRAVHRAARADRARGGSAGRALARGARREPVPRRPRRHGRVPHRPRAGVCRARTHPARRAGPGVRTARRGARLPGRARRGSRPGPADRSAAPDRARPGGGASSVVAGLADAFVSDGTVGERRLGGLLGAV